MQTEVCTTQARTGLGSAIAGMGILSLYEAPVFANPSASPLSLPQALLSETLFSPAAQAGPCTPPSLVWLSGSGALPRI